MPDTTTKPLTQEEIAWFDSPITVQVEPDNQRWLDAMLEMKPQELRQYAVFQYQIPQDAVEGAARDSIMQLIVLANRQGGGGSVIRSRYRYVPGLKGIVPAAITSRRGRMLYLTRGSENSLQVFNSQTEVWKPLAELTSTPRPLDRRAQRRHELSAESGAGFASEFSPQGQRALKAQGDNNDPSQDEDLDDDDQAQPPAPGAAQQAASDAGVGAEGSVDAAPPPVADIPLAVIPRMSVPELKEFATQLGASDVSDEKFPNKGALVDYVTNAVKARQEG